MVKYNFPTKMWSWVNELEAIQDLTDKHIDIIYKMDASPCRIGVCKNNCTSNPFCLNGLGEKKLANLIQKETNVSIERNDYLRDLNDFAGLRNLGATCYINTYLQVWFNNVFFREYILQIPFDKLEFSTVATTTKIEVKNAELKDDQIIEDTFDIIPKFQVDKFECIAKNLQLIFSLMKESIRRSLDPEFFIKALGLDENMQQDAQEFSQLFLTTLQTNLVKSNLSSGFGEEHRKFFSKSTKNNLINDLFKGQYSYITECSSCKFQSNRSSEFIELSLNIQNSNTIIDCINDLLKEEIMDGVNQYYCSNCDRKSNAKRMTKLTSLPPVLNLQLLRFTYDANTMHKKKLTNKIKFSENLDLNAFTKTSATIKTEENASNIYSLGAILMHVGKTAYSGHYMAQIKNFEKNKWLQFNDEVITELKKKQQLGCTDEESEKASTSKEKETADESSKVKTFSTSNAYLLVYYRSDLLAQFKQTNVTKPSNQNEIINKDNQRLNSWFEQLQMSKKNEIETRNSERETMNSIYSSLWIDKQNTEKNIPNYYYINTEFLRKLLTCHNISSNDIQTTCSIQKYLCQHNKLNPLMITKLKLISKMGYDKINEIYNTKISNLSSFFLKAYDPETTRCRECVSSCFEYVKCKERLKNDTKLVKSLLKTEPLIDDISMLSNSSNEFNLKNLVLNGNANEDKYSKKFKPIDEDCMLIENENVTNNDATNQDSSMTHSGKLPLVTIPAIRIRSRSNSSNASEKSAISSSCLDSINENKENSNIDSQNKMFWVGKETLKTWSSIALKRYESKLPTTKTNEENEVDSPKTSNAQNELEIKTIDKDGLEIIEEAKSPANKETETDIIQNDSSLNTFNEDIICPHNSLTPGTTKRLISSKVWNIIFEKYFGHSYKEDSTEKCPKTFSTESRECKLCLQLNEEVASKNDLIKLQKESLADLYYNKQRPNLENLTLNTEYFLLPHEFVKEWRNMVKHNKAKDIGIVNQAFICDHACLPFNEHTIESSMSIVNQREWTKLCENFPRDQIISILKTSNWESEMTNTATDIEQSSYSFIFEPNVCEVCIEKNELKKYLFEKKKIYIKLIEDDCFTPDNQKEADNDTYTNEITEASELAPKRARLQNNPDLEKYVELKQTKSTTTKNLTNKSASSYATIGGTRRSKRVRKGKIDYEVLASSYDTIKQVKVKIVHNIQRMISEQHLFFNGCELENEKTLIDYKINPGDTLNLKLDKAENGDIDNCYENAHLPEVGFKGSYLTG